MAIKSWVRLPSAWILANGLMNMKWQSGGDGSNHTAALMALTVTLLASVSLIYIEHLASKSNPQGVSNAYRIVGVEGYKHMCTQGRAMDGQLQAVSL
jgi:hypothetical protein